MSAALRLPPPATLADLLAIPEDERWHEILNGELSERASPSGEHGARQGELRAFVAPFQRRSGGRWPGGWWFAIEVEVDLGPHDLVRPDLSGWRRERCPEQPRGFPIRLRPDWVCEVLSPTHRGRDLHEKMQIYHRHGIPHYWVLDPDGELLVVHRWTEAGWLVALTARRGETVRAEPFEAIPLQVGVLFGDDPEEPEGG